jgi:catechol 2,3-dioxygenase-like lactoylglutathione lyase family enzyme
MTIKRLDHVSVVVDDLAAAIAFFTEIGAPRRFVDSIPRLSTILLSRFCLAQEGVSNSRREIAAVAGTNLQFTLWI